jgi:hypothetical protein
VRSDDEEEEEEDVGRALQALPREGGIMHSRTFNRKYLLYSILEFILT